MGAAVRGSLLLGLIVLAVGFISAYAWLGRLEIERVTDAVHVIRTPVLGGNVAVLRSDQGAVLVDTMYFPRLQAARVREKAEALTGKPVRAVIDTHYHADHTHGNPAFPAGLRILATVQTRAHLLARDAAYWEGERRERLPNETLETERILDLGDKTVRLIPLRGHTDGDLAVLFVEDRVLHTGDLLFHGFYPNVDLEAGGSFPAWIDALDTLLALEVDFVVPGHGPVADREALRAKQRFLQEVWNEAQKAAREGSSLTQLLEAAELEHARGREPLALPFLFRFDRDFVLRRAFEEATGAVG